MDARAMKLEPKFTSPLWGGRRAKWARSNSVRAVGGRMSEYDLGTVIARREFDCGESKVFLEIGPALIHLMRARRRFAHFASPVWAMAVCGARAESISGASTVLYDAEGGRGPLLFR